MPISIRNIQKAFGAKQVLRGIDYELEDDGIYCLMGPSGMGKTTLLRILMDLETPDEGSVNGLDQNDIAVMFQENRLLEWMDAVDNVAVMRKGIRDKKLKKEIEENLKMILPADCLHQPVTQLSGGMKRRVALARAMNYPSKLIILDEPFTGLDRDTKLEVIDYILKMRKGRILLVATHGTEDAAMLGAKIIHLEELLGVDSLKQDKDGMAKKDIEENGTLGKSAEDSMAGEDEIIFTCEEVMRNMNIFYGIPPERYPEIVQKLGGFEKEYKTNEIVWKQGEGHSCIGVILQGEIQAAEMSGKEPQIIQQFHAGDCFGEAVAFGEQKSWVEIRTTKPTIILYLSVDGLMNDLTDHDFTLMKTNLVREMSNKLAILNLKNQILAEPRLRKRILMYLNILPTNKKGWKNVPFTQKDLAQYLNANRSALSRELARMRDEGLLETNGRRVKVLINDEELMSIMD